MLNLYITRHGETQWNTEKRLQGWLNSPLTEKGTLQGQLLNKAVKMYNISKIYSSPSERALKTAKAARGKLEIEIELMDELKEMNMGDWEGRTLEEIRAKEPENFENYWTRPQLFVKNSGEDFFELVSRTRRAVEKILEENNEGDILIVTHGVTLKSLLSHFTQEDFFAFWTRPVLEQASISMVEVDEERHGVIRLYGDTRHMR
jgi:probable phosphoglycerate mutase